MKSSSTESNRYAALGASSSKDGVLRALGSNESNLFCTIAPHPTGDAEQYAVLHADGAGTKAAAAYLAFREDNNVAWFSGIAIDSAIMNTDDLLCIGCTTGLTLSNSIGRNRERIPDTAIGAIVEGYRSVVTQFSQCGISLALNGGETADIGDLVHTLVVDSTIFGTGRRSDLIRTDRMAPGDLIVGLASFGQATYEATPNSGIGSNGLTLARYALLHPRYGQPYPEAFGGAVRAPLHGTRLLHEFDAELGMTTAQALLSPTRTYVPVLQRIFKEVARNELHAIIHCTGGGQTKIMKFARGLSIIKDSLFVPPPVFQAIQQRASVPWSEMYAVFNMGHRMEIVTPPAVADQIIAIARQFNVEAQVVGRIAHAGDRTTLTLRTPVGEFEY